MSKRAIVCDTTVLLYLGRIGQSDLLPALFSPVYVPEPVMLELDMGRLLRPDTINPHGRTSLHSWLAGDRVFDLSTW